MTVTKSHPVIIAVAPNGARHRSIDHAALPLSPRELARTAADCAGAGATMIHVHVRDDAGQHSLEPEHYRPAVDAIRQTVGERMLIQITSEAAGIYRPDDQIRLMESLMPGGVSIAVREFFVDEIATENAAGFLARLANAGSLIQYILYDVADVLAYRQHLASGAIPSTAHWVLFVLGRYGESDDASDTIADFIAALGNEAPWMACAFGEDAFAALADAARHGGHARIGFENGWLLPDGRIAADNATLVAALANQLRTTGLSIADVDDARRALRFVSL